jgi:3,4-dihydroxy 2-butanone 4-phosphate synthase
MGADDRITEAINELRRGRFVLVHDDDRRENETDLIMAAEFVNSNSIKTMRKDGGGLIVLMIAGEIAEKFGLPFLADVYQNISDRYPLLGRLVPDDLPYDSKSAFSITINHRKTFTGISDADRSLTIRRFAELAREGDIEDFVREFRSPGHVPVCIARKNLLRERKGHTEMAVVLMKIAGLTPVAVGCEMMGDNGRSLSKEDAMKYAEEHGLVFLEGFEIEEGAVRWLEC